MKPIPIHVAEWEARAMWNGDMVQRRVPLQSRWTPRGTTESIVTRSVFAKAKPGDLFWVAQPHTTWRGKGHNEGQFFIDYTTTPMQFAKKPNIVGDWKMKMHFDSAELPRHLSRMTVEIAAVEIKPLIEISDADFAAEALAFIGARHARYAFVNVHFKRLYGDEFAAATTECVLLKFAVHRENYDALVEKRAAA